MKAFHGFGVSVLGSIFAAVTSITFGFSYAILFGAAAYLTALLCATIWIKLRTF